MVDPAPDEVVAEISEERRRVTSQRNTWADWSLPAAATTTCPSRCLTTNVLRLAWRTRFDFIAPSLKKVLRELAGRCTIEDPSSNDVANVKQLTGEEVDRLIIECVETGDTLRRGETAPRKARLLEPHRRKKFIDELTVKI